MDDPDMGEWTYAYNALGELVSQTDVDGLDGGNDIVTTMTYDLLGRMRTRTDDDGGTNEEESEWVYDSTVTPGIGKLAQVKRGGAIERTVSYDSQGRPSSEVHVIPGVGGNSARSYTMSTAYNTSGKVDSVTYPESAHHATGYKVYYHYNVYGYLDKVDDGTTTHWEATGQTAEGQVSAFTLGNNLKTQQLYNLYTGLVQNIDTGFDPVISPTVQQLSFNFDALGNLTSRSDHNQQVTVGGNVVALTESFGYDDLNRVVDSTVNTLTQKTYEYDTLGNLTFKDGVGSYSYGARPHAVTTAGAHTYSYDNNGNQEEKFLGSSSVRDVSYTTYNKAASITAGGNTVSFDYGADRNRLKQTDNNGRELDYVAGAARYEREQKSSGATRHLHYISAGGSVVGIYESAGQITGGTESQVSEKTTYLHRDHLGSITAITSATGAVLEELSYDA